MKLMRKQSFFLTLLPLFVFLLTPFFAFANLEISEVMYDLQNGGDDGREWVEIFNNSEKSFDIADLVFFESETNHKIKIADGGDKILPKSYAIIVADFNKFKIDWPGISGVSGLSGNILDSNFSLNNSGEILTLKDGEIILGQYLYGSNQGGAGDGESLQKVNGAWISAPPTPLAVNKMREKIIISAPVMSQTKISAKIPEANKKITQISENNLQNLSAKIPPNEINSSELKDEINTENKPGYFQYLAYFLFVIFLGVAASAVYFLRKKKSPKNDNSGDDFEILDDD